MHIPQGGTGGDIFILRLSHGGLKATRASLDGISITSYRCMWHDLLSAGTEPTQVRSPWVLSVDDPKGQGRQQTTD